jgi:L-aminopeptidase/D-esterase-like protein
MGSVGAGTGATVGKLLGMRQAQKSGVGIHAIKMGDLEIAAIVVVNAFGDIFKDGKKIAGLLDHNRKDFLDSAEVMLDIFSKPRDMFTGNTTIGCVVTNGKFSKAEMNKIAAMTRNAYARCINPVGTMADGDTIYACSTGDVNADINLVGTLSAKVMEEAIAKAIESSQIDDEEFLTNCRG